jgi:DNA modification methylase
MNFHEDNKHDASRNVLIGTGTMPLRWYLSGEGAELAWGGTVDDKKRLVYRPEQHPCEVMHFIANYCKYEGVVLDSTAGTLKTAEAALRLGRKCIVIEKVDLFLNASVV